MAQEILVGRFLTEEMIKSGGQLLRKLDEAQMPITHALWFFYSEQSKWQLLFSCPIYEQMGPKAIFRIINEQNSTFSKDDYVVPLNSIGLLSVNNSLLQVLNMLIATEPKSISNIRMTNNAVNGIYLEDMYIYRSNRI